MGQTWMVKTNKRRAWFVAWCRSLQHRSVLVSRTTGATHTKVDHNRQLYSRSPKNPALKLLQKRSKSASAGS